MTALIDIGSGTMGGCSVFENTVGLCDAIPAKREIIEILDTITTERGLGVALEAAATMQRAIAEGRIMGNCYINALRPDCGCLVGHLAKALGWRSWFNDGPPVVPGWEGGGIQGSHLERLVYHVVSGQTGQTSNALALVEKWVTEWVQHQRALPGDEA